MWMEIAINKVYEKKLAQFEKDVEFDTVIVLQCTTSNITAGVQVDY